ncbi:M14 family metallopeptidase [Algivirga pacifica]|uniref:M14 family metallopeptidase n=1 Tax=Algivirga pacifica TaxID=1162670 RepID=A0ABP9DHX7_9BACT
MKLFFFNLFVLFLVTACTQTVEVSNQNLSTKFEDSKGEETVTYQEGIAYLQQLDDLFEAFQLKEIGTTDAGLPLHLGILSTDQSFDLERIKEKRVLLINNGIHPGEPDGVDASLMLLRDILQDKASYGEWEDVVVAVIPFYNVGGALNRNSHTRANQEGPVAYGFRGNAQNLDLNRDFIKMNSRNMETFASIFHQLDPDLFIDTHVSNGADYQYVMTYLATQEDKLGGKLGEFSRHTVTPFMKDKMREASFEMTPYVNVWGTVPDSGYVQFMDSPRYSSGYTTLFHTLSYVTETHMLKPFKQRTEATYNFLKEAMIFMKEHGKELKSLRAQTAEQVKQQEDFPIAWELDDTQKSRLLFKGYKGIYKPSEVSGLPRLYYDRTQPFEKEIDFYNHFKPKTTVKRPKGYLIPAGWYTVVDKLKRNGVAVQTLSEDTVMDVTVYHIDDFKTRQAYEGHYLHYDIKVTTQKEQLRARKGDYFVEANQASNRYIIETLEPHATDSFFAWNFFDAILQQKEGFSSYVFEDKAAEYLQKYPEIREALERKKAADPAFAKNAYAQLQFVYQQTPHYERAHRRYPVYRVELLSW